MLTFRQELFAKEYLVDLNATQAAIRAGYSEKTAGSQGERLLKNVEISAVIQSNMDKRAAKIEITSEKVLQEIAKLAFSNLQDFYDESGQLKDIHSLPRDVAACLLSNKINLTEACAVQEIKLHDKKGSLELLGRHLRLFNDVGSKENPLNVNKLHEMTEEELLAIATSRSN